MTVSSDTSSSSNNSGSSRKGRHYGRFVPREEVGEVMHWQFGDVTLPQVWQPLPSLLTHGSARTAHALQANAEAAHALAEAAQAADTAQQAQWQQACEAALVQGRAEATVEWQQRLDDYVAGEGQSAASRLEMAVQQLGAQLAALQQHMAQDVLQLACALARQVVRQELRSNPEALAPVVAEALDMLVADGRPATVRLHPDDHTQVGAALRERFDGKALQWLPDAAVAPGGCLVEAAGAVVDGSLEKRWQRAVAALGVVSAGTFDGGRDGA